MAGNTLGKAADRCRLLIIFSSSRFSIYAEILQICAVGRKGEEDGKLTVRDPMPVTSCSADALLPAVLPGVREIPG